MDDFLESQDLGEIFSSRGKVAESKTKKINLDLPEAILEKIDQIAAQIGIARQPLLKMWIHEKIKEEASAVT